MGIFDIVGNLIFKRTKQKVEHIENSPVNQAGRDQYILNNGVSFNEVNTLLANMKGIIKDVVRSELQNHDQVAQQTIRARVVEYDEAVTEILGTPENIPLLEKFERPDVQRVLRTSLIQYICKGDQETKESMVDMMIDRLNTDGKTWNNLSLKKQSLYCRNFLRLLFPFLRFSISGAYLLGETLLV